MTGPSCLVQWQLSGSARCEGIVGWTLQDWQFFLTRGGKTFTYLIQAHKSPILEGPVGKNVIEIGYNFSDIFGGTEYLCIYSQACSSGPSVARSKSPKSSMLGNGNLGPRSGGTPSNHSTYQESSKRKSLDANEQIHHFCCSFSCHEESFRFSRERSANPYTGPGTLLGCSGTHGSRRKGCKEQRLKG